MFSLEPRQYVLIIEIKGIFCAKSRGLSVSDGVCGLVCSRTDCVCVESRTLPASGGRSRGGRRPELASLRRRRDRGRGRTGDLKFGCGSRVRLNAGTVARVTFESPYLVVQLSSGAKEYKMAKGCPVQFAGANRSPATPTQISGTAFLSNKLMTFGLLPAGAAGGLVTELHGSDPPAASPSR